MQLRPYQVRAVTQARRSMADGNRNLLLVSPTGSGKTVMLSWITQSAVQRGGRVVILAHRGELLRQLSGGMQAFGVRHGVIAPAPLGRPDPLAPVQVASVQTLARRLDKRLPPCDLLIIDEAHHAVMGNTWGRVLAALQPSTVLGLTATPCRTDGKGLGEEAGGPFQTLIEVTSVAELIRDGFLARPVVYAPPSSADLSGLRKRGGDFAKDDLVKAMDKPTITGDAVGHYARICPGVPAVAFGVSLEHCEHIAAEFRGRGYRAATIDGSMDDGTRRRLLEDLGKGLQVLVSCDLIGEGVDVPAIGAAILLRPTASVSLYLQQVGRALRPHPGKPHAVILDHVGNVLRHGMPDEARDWTLDGVQKRGRKKEDGPEVSVIQCKACYAVSPGGSDTCEGCGAPFERKPRGSNLEQVAGELVQITAEMRAEMAKSRNREVAMARTEEELWKIARERGYKPGWVYHTMKVRQQKAHRAHGGA